MNIHAVPSVYQKTRCIFTAGIIETGQSQAKRCPVASFRSKEFIHRVTPAIVIFNRAVTNNTQVDVISPDGWSAALEQLAQRTPAQFYRVNATLGQIFEKAFFLEHVKTGKRRHKSQKEGANLPQETSPCCRKGIPPQAIHFHSTEVQEAAMNTLDPNLTYNKGKLKLHLDREAYERSGLTGKLNERTGTRELRSKWCKY